MARTEYRGASPLWSWQKGRPERWSRENLIKRGKALAEYCQSIIDARYGELGVARDTQHRMQQQINDLTRRLDAALLAVDKMSWGIMHSEYGKAVLEDPENKERLEELNARDSDRTPA